MGLIPAVSPDDSDFEVADETVDETEWPPGLFASTGVSEH